MATVTAITFSLFGYALATAGNGPARVVSHVAK
jgi:hypothetical protein